MTTDYGTDMDTVVGAYVGAASELDEAYEEIRRLREASADTSTVLHRILRERERYRLAWTSARERAATYADIIDEDREERDGLRAALSGALKALDHAEGLIEERDARNESLAAALLELRGVHARCGTEKEEVGS